MKRKRVGDERRCQRSGQLPDNQGEQTPSLLMSFSVFITQGEEKFQDMPADLLITWRKRGLMIHLLVGWGRMRPYRGLARSGPGTFPSRGQEGGCSRWGRGHYNYSEVGGVKIRVW